MAAGETDAGLLGVAAGAPLLRERRLTRDSNGVPLEWSDDRYRPDLATFTMTSTRGRRVRSG